MRAREKELSVHAVAVFQRVRSGIDEAVGVLVQIVRRAQGLQSGEGDVQQWRSTDLGNRGPFKVNRRSGCVGLL